MFNLPSEKLQTLKRAIDKSLKDSTAEPIAAFDADGTLWASDLGENFLRFIYKNKLIKDLPENPEQIFSNLCESHKEEEALLWVAQVSAGQHISQVKKWANESFQVQPKEIFFPFQRELIDYLRNLSVEVFIVTASPSLAIQPAAEYLFKLPPENVLGIQTKIENDFITNKLDGTISWKEGKVKRLLEATAGRKPFFVAGNSLGDLPLLKSSSHLKLVISAAQPRKDFPEKAFPNRRHQSELSLLEIAKKENWFYHQF